MASANVYHVGKNIGSRNQQAVNLVLDRVRHTVESYGDYFQTLLKFHRFYLSSNQAPSRPEPPDIDNAGREWRADIFVPYSFATIESALPRLHDSLFGKRPFIKMVGRELSDHKKAEQTTSLLDYDFERAEVSYKGLLALKSFLKYGITIGKVAWKRELYEEKYVGYEVQPIFDNFGTPIRFEEKEVITTRMKPKFDGPTFEPVSVFNFFPDPLYYNIEDMRYVAELVLTDLETLRMENEGFKALTGKNLYTGLGDLQGMGHHEALTRAGTWLGDSREETAQIFGFGHGLNRRFGATSGGPFSQEMKGDEVWLLHYFEKDRHIVVANGQKAIRDADNMFADEEYPYFAANAFPIEFEFYGQGMLHPVAGIQEEVNSWRNIAIDQGKLNMMKPIAYDGTSGLTDLDFDIFPGSATPVKFEGGKPLAVPLFPRDTLPPETYQIEGMLLRDWQNALGMNDYMIGGGGGDAGTAREAQMMNQSAQGRLKMQALIGQQRFVVKLARKFFGLRQQFLDQEEVFRILGREGYEFPNIGPDDISGQYDFLAQGNVIGPNKEVLRQQWIQMMTTTATNPIMAQRINWQEVLEEGMSLFDFRDPSRFLLPPNRWSLSAEQLKQMLQMAIMAKDHNLIESLSKELQMIESMQMGMKGEGGGGQGNQNNQEAGGATGQGAGQIATDPFQSMPSEGGLQAQAMGGPGV